jgi:hypothetical protein
MTDQMDEILAGLEPLFKEAEERKLWFYANYQQMWYSPTELKAQHAKGYLIWGAVNWQLRNPYELMNELDAQIRGTEQRKKDLYKRIEQG